MIYVSKPGDMRIYHKIRGFANLAIWKKSNNYMEGSGSATIK